MTSLNTPVSSLGRTAGSWGREHEPVSAEKFASMSEQEKGSLHKKWIISSQDVDNLDQYKFK